MTIARQRLGRRAEQLAAERLRSAGWRILARNARTRHGEIDLIASDGRTIVFVEVKAARAGSQLGPERPVLAVDRRKQIRIRRLAMAWLAETRPPFHRELRFDVIGIRFGAGGEIADYEHIVGAF